MVTIGHVRLPKKGSPMKITGRTLLAATLVGTMVLTGCASVGPKSVTVDRFDYSTAIADSWKQQTLLNIVKLRYLDLPVFVDVSSIVAGYSMQTGVTANGVLSTEKAVQGNYMSAGGQVIYTDRPTITYVPMTGERFMRGLLAPIDPKNIFSMLQSGYAADFILALTVESLNGLRNRAVATGVVREADPEFLRVLELIRDVQAVGAVGMRVEHDSVRGQVAVLFFRRDSLDAEIVKKLAEIRTLLGLPADRQKFVLVYSPVRGEEGELAVNSRSMMQILGALASYMEAPEEHLQDHSVMPGFEHTALEAGEDRLRIHSGKERPEHAYAAVQYRGYWYWIDDSNWKAKRAMTAVLFFFTLAETGDSGQKPVITIPAQ